MFLLTDDETRPLLVVSASDLTRASECEFGFSRSLDAKLGRVEAVVDEPDAMLQRAAALGTQHEDRVLERYRASGRVIEIARPERLDRAGLAQRATETASAFAAAPDTLFQATFFDEAHAVVAEGTPDQLSVGFLGFADFIVRARSEGGAPDAPARWRVQDTKLSRRAKVTALLQLAAYAQQLRRLGLAVADEVDLILGDGGVSIHRLADIAPVHRHREARLLALIERRRRATGATPWRDADLAHCGDCAWCRAEITAHDDVWQVAGLRGGQWSRLAAAGITTLPGLADSVGPVDGIGGAALEGLRAQARLQHAAVIGAPPPVEWTNPDALRVLPEASPGDIFFDFEGDPLYREAGPSVGGAAGGSGAGVGGDRWGLDYLFGLVDVEGRFTAFWAHDLAEERRALRGFLDDLARRRAAHPQMHVYHYAPYERTHLLSLAARHGEGEDEVDQLLREGVLVDLYPIVRAAMRLGSSSYSIKKLEPLYLPEARAGAAVADGAASVDQYARAIAARDDGDETGFRPLLAEIAAYNRIDCESTRALRDWLVDRAGEHGVPTGSAALDGIDPPQPRELEPSPLRESLLRLAGTAGEPDRTDDERAWAFAAAAIDYHRREHKSFWWDHFARLSAPVADFADTRDVLSVTSGEQLTMVWYRDTPRQSLRRHVRLRGSWAPGSRPSLSSQAGPFALYDLPGPFAAPGADPLARPARSVRIIAIHDDGVTIEETLPKGVDPYDDIPVALTPASPPSPGQQKPAIEEWGRELAEAAPEWPVDPVGDLLRRIPPRTRSGALAPVTVDAQGEPDRVSAVVASLLDLDRSYLAVQGPPGTGKTYLGSRVIARLVAEHGWRIGVVAQGHSTVEHVLSAVVDAGLPPARVGKCPREGEAEETRAYSVVPRGTLGSWIGEQPAGFVVGGTAWDLADPKRVGRRSLDLLVVDEAGQFSLAATIASAMSARALLLLGDPQQLPQVSQGTHPEPVDGSALGFLSAGHDVLPAELGYFLAESRRMHPAVSDVVSTLSYEGALHAHPSAALRSLDGVEPGVHAVPVEHHGNAVDSPEEAARVVEIVRGLLGTAWRPSADAVPDALRDSDVIVVTPFNAQQQLVREHLDAAGLTGTRVGTVDKFQGQEAVVAIVSLCASSAAEVPRGMDFLLNRNRLNVAISRAQWAAFVVHSPALVDYLPRSAEGVAELSAFLRIVQPEPGA
ncbi:AAA domain-containing protein [Microcella daejeonensis]|uniref:AAA domain-containing protein n=1 Tax=Microcella daejeonensis TaxID=2994971 RepID=UPI0022702908|nr:AAA domain-containing protein [Microcella daejeonensis]WAB83196.1 AAA domain-containing protein [Microcella daejeonensis]